VPEQDQADKKDKVNKLYPNSEKLLERAEPCQLGISDPGRQGKAEKHNEKVEEFLGF